jgi:hypothetical protein
MVRQASKIRTIIWLATQFARLPAAFGTILATTLVAVDRRQRSCTGAAPSGAPRCAAFAQMILAFQMLVMCALAGLSSSCVTLAPENATAPTATKTLHIQLDKADPRVIETWVYTVGSAKDFRVNGAITQINVSQQLNYLWLADYDPKAAKNVQNYIVKNCILADAICTVDFCALDATPANVHRLRVVVSDVKLSAKAVTPWDFPVGTAFDSIEWTVTIPTGCP